MTKKITLNFTDEAIKTIQSKLAISKMCDNMSFSDGVLSVIIMLIKGGRKEANFNKEILDSIEKETIG